MNTLNAKVKTVRTPVHSITWNNVIYRPHMVSDFLGFVAFLVKDDWFTINIEGEEFKVHIYFDGYVGFNATTDNYDGPDRLNLCHSTKSRADALAGLVEQLSENILEKQ
jgi:hypothetical protein